MSEEKATPGSADGVIMDLKLRKTTLKTAFTKTKNKILQCVQLEDTINKTEVKSLQNRLDSILDEVMATLNELFSIYKQEKEFVKANKVMEEIDKVDTDYSGAHLLVKEALDAHKSNSSLASAYKGGELEKIEYNLCKQMRRIGIPTFYGDKRKYESWKAAFNACIDSAAATPEYKLLQLRQYVDGDALRAIDELGHSADAYVAAKDRLDRKFGGERRKVMRFMDDLDKFPPIKNEDSKSIEKFADLLEIVVLKLKETEREEDLGDGALYLSVQKKMTEHMLTRYHRWLFETKETENVETLKDWVVQESSYLTIANETKNGLSQSTGSQSNENKSKKNQANYSYFTETSHKKNCKVCNMSHRVWECEQFKEMDVQSRWKTAKELRLCYRCLNDSHLGNKCKNFRKCSVDGCLKTHNRLLHQSTLPISILNENAQIFTPKTETMTIQQFFYNSKMKVALRTVPVCLIANGKRLKCNALLDDGSTKTYISHNIAAELGLQGKAERVTVSVLSGRTETFETMSVFLQVESLNGLSKIEIEASVLDNVTGSLQTVDWVKQSKKWEHLQGIQFPVIEDNNRIDILIGLDYAQLHTSIHEIHGEPGQPTARLTPLGWTCVGKLDDKEHTSMFATYFVNEQFELNDIMKGFWETDSYGTTHCEKTSLLYSKEKDILNSTEQSLEFKEGHYEVSIPWKDEPCLPDNYEMASKRLAQIERKLKKTTEVETMYRETIDKYIEKGYLRKVDKHEEQPDSKWYLPHFPVVHLDRETTKVRIVFDAAAKQDGVCLNDFIHQGPKLQNELFDILLRFRKHEIAVVCDISEMYLQVGINKTDRRYHRMLWDNSEYEFNRLVFGVNASPYLAQFVSQANARKYASEFPEAAETVLKSTYMDDSMDSVCSEEEGIELYNQLSKLWRKAGMYARKWISNSVQVLEQVPIQDRASEVNLDTGYLPTTKALGVIWQTDNDLFTFKLNKDVSTQPKMTKRNLLRSVASLFDPLGFISPYIVQGKILMQNVWLRQYDWDEEIEIELANEIRNWLYEIVELDKVTIPRSLSFVPTSTSELHTFVDASQEACGSVIFVRHQNKSGDIEVKFVCSKTRVAPLISTSIPRLELMAAVLGLRLTLIVTKALGMSVKDTVFWSDSTNVLWWISRPSRSYKPFVANRVGEIHESTIPAQWRYVPTGENPADLASRGASAEKLIQSQLWWNGPEFLYLDNEHWPENKVKSEPNHIGTELKKSAKDNTYIAVNSCESGKILSPDNYSDWLRLIRVYAWMNRFISNCRSIIKQTETELTLEELREAEHFFIRNAQLESYSDEFISLSKGEPLSTNSKLSKLNVRIDENGVLRCDTRLKYANFLPYSTRFPIVLPRKSRVSKLIVKYHHEQGHHCGTNQTLSAISANYWIVSAREEIREWEKECAQCRKTKSRAGNQIMAPLPDVRIKKSMRAFTHCSVDFGGPFLTKQGRGKTRQKRYLCLFTCMASRAVHIEMAFGLDTDSFLNAFYRMASRRGYPDEIYSDNGTNFVGAYRELKDLYQQIDKDKLIKDGSKHAVKWHFNPPLAPHFGGIHESMIKTAKRAIYKVLTGADLTDEELLTAFTGAEGLINSRPIAYQTAHPGDDSVLTPNHFLHGQAGGQFAPESVDRTVFDIRKRWRRVQEIMKHFWQRWLREFLPTLSGRKKWFRENRDFKTGDVVLVIDPDKPRGQWSLGRITEVFPGVDGHVRVVNVRVGKTIYRRAITKLCLIEKNCSDINIKNRLTGKNHLTR